MRRNIVVFVLIVVVLGLFSTRCKSAEEPSARRLPTVYTEKVDSTADMTQTDPAARLPNGGRAHCGPVSVSNSLMWLAENGFDKLVTSLPDRRKAQFELARTLGSKKYMNTNLKTGTGPLKLTI